LNDLFCIWTAAKAKYEQILHNIGILFRQYNEQEQAKQKLNHGIVRVGWQLHWASLSETLEIVEEEISHNNQMNELTSQNNVARQPGASTSRQFLETAQPEPQLKDSRES
jgi:hypothetical protein